MSINELLGNINRFILNPLIALLFAVAFLVFAWGIFQFIKGAANEEVRIKGQRNILWGIVGMLIMFSVFGIINIILNTFGLDAPPYIDNLI